MITIESAINEIYNFARRFVRTYLNSAIYGKQLIQKIRYNNTGDLINPYLYLIISFFIYFSILNTIFFTDRETPFLLFASINKFYTNYTLIEKLLIISPLIILSEAVLALLSVLLIRIKEERTLFRNLYRYFISSILLTFVLTFFVLVLLEFILENLNNKKYYILMYTYWSVLLAFLPAFISTASLIVVIFRENLLFNKIPKLLSFLLIPLVGFSMAVLLTITAYPIYQFYNLKLSTNKVQISSIESINELIIKISNDSTDLTYSRILRSDDFELNDDSLINVETYIFLKNFGEKESIINLSEFEIVVSYYDSFMEEQSTFNLKADQLTAKNEKLLILRPGESNVIPFKGLMEVKELKFIAKDELNRAKHKIEYNVLPWYRDGSSHIIQKLFVRLGYNVDADYLILAPH